MFMKSKYKIYIALAAFLTTTGCGDEFLTKQPQGQFSSAGLATEAGVEGLLLGAYKMLSGTGLDGQAPWENDVQNWVFGGIASDDAYKGTDAGDQPEQSFIEAYDFQAFNGHIKNKWRGLYKGVARTNDVLNTLKKVEGISDARKSQLTAEAKFLRGFFHMEARKMWRNPPYIDDTIFDINDVESTKVPNDKEIWPLIEADLKAAMDALPETQAQVGRPTKWAAMAFLAKAYMFQGFSNTGTPNAAKLTAAKALLDQIVNSGRFRLVDNFQDNFMVRTRNNAESIFEIQYAVSSANDQASNQGVGLAHPYIDPWGCCGFYQASQNLVNAFKTDANGLPLLDTYNNSDVTWQTTYTGPLDPRIDHSLGRPGILFKDFKIHQTDFIRDVSYAGPYSSMKHVSEKAAFGVGGWGNLTANNYRIMRYDMVLLWLAECEVEVGSLERARALVNQIRTRAANTASWVPKAIQGATRNDFTIVPGEYAANYKISNYTSPWTDKEVARKAVRFETRLEFAMEGHRFFDLQRWGIAASTLNAFLNVERTKRVYLAGKSFTANKNEFYPIPLEALDRSLKGGVPTLKQDPAY
jgi:starch-binding outer membrane protein, SusD/RagB family